MARYTEPDEFCLAVAEQIREHREAAGYTQGEVMQLLGMPRTTYLHIEHGTRAGDLVQLRTIAAALGMTMSTLMARAESHPAQNR